MKNIIFHIHLIFFFLIVTPPSSAETIITIDGKWMSVNATQIQNGKIVYTSGQTAEGTADTISQDSAATVIYPDGSRLTFTCSRKTAATDNKLYSAYVFCETGLFGLINVNESFFDPGIFTIGVTPSIDRKLNDFFSIGVEYMILWVQPNADVASRFLMNCNGVFRLSFPINDRFRFLTQLNAGLSIWPGAESVLEQEATFFNDRIGWDFHGGIGIEYKTIGNSSLILNVAYNANFSTLDEIPITIDMLLLSVGPRLRF